MTDDAPPDDTAREFSGTEDVPATPGWVEGEFDDLLGTLPDRPSIHALRARYLDGLGASLTEAARDRCRADFLRGLEGDGIEAPDRGEIERRLIALEAEISTRT